jgi:PelA/Pel-15E family pectate lyase
LLTAQMPNGCWPQIYPLQGSYHDAITFNDDATINALEVMAEVARGRHAFLAPAVVDSARTSVREGIRCIVQTQVGVNGFKTVWGAQHDPLTLQPIRARAYEHPSLSGRESGAVLDFLMRVDNPDSAVVNAVHAAAAWFRSNAIRGYSYVPRGQLTPDPNGGPLWARFYEIGSNRPIFSDRDGVIRYNLNEIGAERRSGYLWYTDEPASTLRRYQAWARQHPSR